MMNMQGAFQFGQILFVVVPIIIVTVMIFTLAMAISPKLRGKVMSRQVKATKYMTEYSKDDIEDIMSDLGGAAIKAQNNMINENEDILRDTASKEADIKKEAVKTTARAIKEGLQDTMYCKHCGALIDADSKFCKSCGKEV